MEITLKCSNEKMMLSLLSTLNTCSLASQKEGQRLILFLSTSDLLKMEEKSVVTRCNLSPLELEHRKSHLNMK